MIELDDVPELAEPVLVAAFEGWNDAADSATAVVDYLADLWEAKPIGEVDPDNYYDYQVNRPQIRLRKPSGPPLPHPSAAPDTAESVDPLLETGDEAPERELTWPTTQFLLARPPAAPRDVLLVRGIEPNLRWSSFCDDILAVADALGVNLALTLGALLADNPHTRPIPVSATSGDPEVRQAYDVPASLYEGPAGIVGVLDDASRRADLPMLSVWAAVPHYVAQPPCPKATLGLLHRIEDLLDVSIPLGELPEEARAWERGVDDLAADDTEISEYVRSLEQARDASDLPEASGDAIAAEFERYLRRRPDSGNT